MFQFASIEIGSTTVHLISYDEYDTSSLVGILHPCELERYNSFSSEKRRMEFIATRILKDRIAKGALIKYTEIGSPYLDNHPHISISHSAGVSSIAINEKHTIGLDIETISKKASRLYTKFLNEEEQASLDVTDDLLMTKTWSVKESLLKLSGRKGITFKRDLLIDEYDGINTFNCRIHKNDNFYSVVLHSFRWRDIIVSINVDNLKQKL